MKAPKTQSAFTLVELIVVITILAILWTIGFLSLQGYSSSARDSTRVSDVTNVSKALELYQIKTGAYPVPTNATSYTWGANGWNIIQQGALNGALIGFSNSRPSDPETKIPYAYSILTSGSYYQVAADMENPVARVSPLLETAFADSTSKVALVRWNYVTDPSLPSLIVIPSSIPSAAWSGGIFSPDVCFVTNGSSTNVISAGAMGCTKKKDIALKSLDSSLVGYWDMETYYQASYSGTSNVVFLKDLSGNGYDMYMGSWAAFLSSISTSSGSIFARSAIGNGVMFDNTNFKYGFGTIPLWESFTLGGRTTNYVPWNVFAQSSDNSGSTLLPGITASIVFDYDRNGAQSWWVKRMVSFNLSNYENVDVGDFSKVIDSSFARFSGNSLQEHITPYNDWPSTSTGIYWFPWCGNGNSVIDWPDMCQPEFSKYQANTISWKNTLTAKLDFRSKKYCLYLNGTQFACEDIQQSVIDRLQEGWYKYWGFSISSWWWEQFSGIIDDVEIYNRAFSDSEIKQHAQAAGF